ncbi:MAG: amidohydrolase family protein [Candidatus Korarchaeota archaeon]|nr:amidohydrolase family protein [Candidatus Korarchaeota archaeon]NIU82810.1 amidohydrolase family protein [Candidatus Thorarchaeota archaeon]NIW15329.1 amidohydrolase family protein [Candidatus Thorarchaeota archaeon]NIW53294.1 amidohydrolase family protein [Candidatus Korarchaeota archaeon]
MNEKVDIVIKCGRLIDGTGAEPVEDGVIVIQGTKIAKVGTVNELKLPQDATFIDASDKTVMPGLIDSHLHLYGMVTDDFLKEMYVRDEEVGIVKTVFDVQDLLKAGFTTVKDCGSKGGLYVKKALQEPWASARMQAPRIITAGYVTLSQTFGHADAHFFPLEYAKKENPGICDGVPECIQKARLALREGADFIKIMASGGVLSQRDRPEHTQFTLNELKAIVREAEKVGTFVTAHCQGTEAIKLSIKAGVKTIDHAFYPDEEGLTLAKANNVIFVPTLSISHQINTGGIEAGYPEWGVRKSRESWEEVCKNIERAHKAGVPIAAATDFCGSELLKHGTNAMELELLVKECGFTPMDAIVSATQNGAKACGLEHQIGTLEADKLADLLIVDGDPLQDISILQDHAKIKGVMKEGVMEVNRGL